MKHTNPAKCAICIELLELGPELLLIILRHCGPCDVVRLACTCKLARDVAYDDSLWRSICLQRWHHVEEPSASYRTLFVRDHGWREPKFFRCILGTGEQDDFVSAVQAYGAAVGHQPQCNVLAMANDSAVQLYHLTKPGNTSSEAIATRKVASHPIAGDSMVLSLALPSHNVVATGDNWGVIEVLHHQEGSGELKKSAALRSQSFSRSPAVSLCCLDSSPSSSDGLLAVLHDSTFSLAENQRNCVRLFDLEAQAELRHCCEHLESYEYVAIARLGGAQQGAAQAQQLVAGAVHGSFCRACYDAGVPSLCWHKSQVHTAVLSILDFRTAGSLAQRYSTHHRSLYPNIASARQHYLFTSHAGTSLCAWDLRQMSMPLYEQQQHLNHTAAPSPGAAPWPLPPAAEPPSCQAMWLDTDGDVLLGRADNGMMWIWDLSHTLGWARSGGAGQKQGSWQQLLEQPGLSQEELFELPQGWLQPMPLGALPCENSLAIAQLCHGPACHLLCWGAEASKEEEHVQIMRLQL